MFSLRYAANRYHRPAAGVKLLLDAIDLQNALALAKDVALNHTG